MFCHFRGLGLFADIALSVLALFPSQGKSYFPSPGKHQHSKFVLFSFPYMLSVAFCCFLRLLSAVGSHPPLPQHHTLLSDCPTADLFNISLPTQNVFTLVPSALHFTPSRCTETPPRPLLEAQEVLYPVLLLHF